MMRNSRKGVSLIAVLLFMLIATIAATATYKWLSSTGSSSSSRMMQNEARLAALAGIESARSWMTYHGNETGAIIKQYFASGNKPVSLDGVLAESSNTKEEFHVYLVGADVSSTEYKLKLVSKGTSRQGEATHSESAIMKVTGLYRVQKPSKGSTIDFKYAYVGGSTSYSGTTNMNSLIVNGNWSGNPPKTTAGDFVVTGNASLSGSDINVEGTTCIGGQLNANNAITTQDLYVDGTTSGSAMRVDVSGNAYFKGNVSQGDQAITIGGSLTTEGVIKTKASAASFSVAKNLCVEDGGQIHQDNFNRSFTVTGNVWMPHQDKLPVYTGNGDADNYSKIILGNTSESMAYIEDGYPYEEYVSHRSAKTITETGGKNVDCQYAYPWGNVSYCYGWKTWGTQTGTEEYDCSWPGPWGSTYTAKCTRATYSSDTYTPYINVNKKDKMYYFYYMPSGVEDVDFGSYTSSTYMTWGAGSSRAEMYGYYLGGNLFHEAGTSTYNYLNYNGSANSNTSSPYCYKGSEFRPECRVSPWFTSQGTVTNSMPAEKPFTCGEPAKAHCDSIWETGPGCDGAPYKIPELLQTGYSAFSQYANTAQCSKDIMSLDNNARQNFNVSKINDCYKDLKADQDSASTRLYNGYLVLKFPDGTWFKNTSGTLTGKYIFIIEGNSGEALKLPGTNSSSYVMLYLAGGWGNEIQQSGSGPFNYFIYSKGDISRMMSTTWDGTIYMPMSGCWKIENFQSSTLNFNQSLLDDMTQNSIICKASASTCGGAPVSSTGTSSTSTSTGSDGYDSDFISVGAQLHIEMESEYKSTEKVSSDTATVNPSILVMPRIVYLTQNPVGKLSDYYNVISLNGAQVSGNGNANCSGSIPTSGTMVTGSELIEEGIYTCAYQESNYKDTFYVYVSGLTEESPKVHFETPEDTKINSGEPSSNVVNLVIEGVTGATSTEISVDITVQHPDLDGWTLTPYDGSVVEHTGSAGDKIFTYTGTASSSTVTVPLFTVTTEQNAKSGSMIFIMQTPVNCTISSPSAKSYNIYGKATVVRHELSDYCSKYTCTTTEQEAITRDECDLGGTWVTASGSGCTSDTDNKKWICDAGNGSSSPITLTEGSYEDKYCQIFIPTENNSIVGALDDDENAESPYVLYASLKKRKFNLHVGFSGALDGQVIVKTKQKLSDSFTKLETCSNHTDGCDYSFYVNTYVEIEADAQGDFFSYWACSGASCRSEKIPSTTYDFVMDNDFSITAKFNANDRYCFYTDFADASIWCENDEQKDCIDYCASGTSCSVDKARHSNINWNMIHSNSGSSFSKPSIDSRLSSNSYLSYDGDGKTSEIAMILNTADSAGYNGTLTTRLKTGITCHEKNAFLLCYSSRNNYMLNSGFVFRSNADGTEYISLSLYATAYSAAGLALGIAEHTYARACYVNALALTSSTGSNCKEVEIKTKNLNAVFQYEILIPLNLDVVLDGNTMTLSATYAKSAELFEGTASIDLSTLGNALADPLHTYMGIKLNDDKFRVGDISWSAESKENCFSEPSVTCSFASNYLGGMVPKDSVVSPWVGFSSWFANKGSACVTKVKYYYNGCDMSSSYYKNGLSALITNSVICSDASADGYYTNLIGDDGLQLNGSSYNFSYEGQHGVEKTGGIVRNASVEVDCKDVNGHTYEESCGAFYVGEKHECSDNESIFTGDDYISSTETTYEVTGGTVNLRGSLLNVLVENLYEGNSVIVKLVDESGNESLTETGSVNGNNEISVDNMSDAPGFNPEKVKKVKISSTSNCTLKSISSSCPNAVGISNCNATYSGSQWTLSSNLSNSDKALKCMITTTDVSSSEDADHINKIIDCNKSGTFTVNDEDFYTELNSSADAGKTLKYSFTINVYNDADATETSTPSATCVAESNTYSQADVSNCSIDATEKIQGLGVPTLTYSIVDCPDYGCYYDVELSDGTTLTDKDPATIPAAGRTGLTWQPTVNNASSYLSEGQYHYTVTAHNSDNSKTYSTCTSDNFTVKKATEANGSCSINGNTLTLMVYGANNIDNVPVSLSYNDNIGINIGITAINMNGSETKNVDLSGLTGSTSFVIKLAVGSKTYDCGTYTPASSSSSSSSTVASSSSSAIGGVTGTCVAKYNNSEITSTYIGNSNVIFSAKSVTGSKAENQTMSLYLGTEKIKDLSCHIYADGSGSCWNGDNVTMPSTAGSYTYELKYNGNTVCSKTLSIDDPVTCSVDKTEVSSGTKVTFTGAGTAPGAQSGSCGFKINGNWKDGNQNQNLTNGSMEYTITGTTVLTFECTQGSASNRSCSKTVSVTESAPSFDCDETTAVVGASNNVTITPKNVSGCTNGCAYGISGTSVATSSFTYNSGALPSFTGSGTNGTTATYEVSLTNSVATTKKNCSVKYQEASSASKTLCLNAQNGEANAPASNKSGSLANGSYTFLHNCGTSNGWWYTCSGSGSITIGSTEYSCSGGEKSSYSNGIGNVPASGSVITVPSGVTLNNIGCPSSGSTPVTGCSTTGLITGSSSSGGSGSSATSSMEITQDNDFGNNLKKVQGTVTITCKNGSNPAKTLRCCPSDCNNGTLSSDLYMGSTNMGKYPRLYNASVSCTDGTSVEIKSSDPVYCGVANYN